MIVLAQNYVLLERIELAASAASVTFSNIPQSGYTDLKIVMSTRAADSANNWYLTKIQFNTDTTSGNYSSRILAGFGSSTFSATSSNYAGYIPSGARTANTFGNNEIYIPNYLGSTAKSFSTDTVTEGNGSSYEILGLWAGLWSGTAAINQVVLSPDTGSWAANSTFSIYGLAAVGTTPAIAPKATGGNVITTDGTYWYHAFTASGTFTPLQSLLCDYLVVAGGGGGAAGGGGAGGLRSTVTTSGGGASPESPLSLTAQGYTVTIGGGGGYSTSGENSVFASITSTGGGGSGEDAGKNGGSGGGGGNTSPGTGGTGTAGQGYAGGIGYIANQSSGGGGGGAGQAGFAGTSNVGGNAGNGVQITALATPTGTGANSGYYAGGGGGGGVNSGGSAGLGGGSAGTAYNTTAANATANTGGGGGRSNGTNGQGGSGIVIIRYLMA